ncbi:hypothetical protein UPTC15622_00180 [Campylobacter lari]|uniref:hypothetical protein n=1 Tax=Campylobacter lari TaxID=201 RepID=UPI00215344A2|nr:hypothetical protein [Campylobacter lari]MCR6565156.1 hypothetical protein [Campylobacter lari]
MYRISKDELRRYILEQISDDVKIKQVEDLIEKAMKDLQYTEINIKNIDEVTKYILEKNTLADKKLSSSRKNNFLPFLTALIIGGSGVYYYKNETRYTVKEEYAFISTCVGLNLSHERKWACIAKLEICQKNEKSFVECAKHYSSE